MAASIDRAVLLTRVKDLDRMLRRQMLRRVRDHKLKKKDKKK